VDTDTSSRRVSRSIPARRWTTSTAGTSRRT